MDPLKTHAEAPIPERTSTLVGANVVIRGDLEGATDFQLEGRVTGHVSVVGLIMAEGAEIEGPVTAEAVVISGRINGSVDAMAVHLKSTARVEGDITYTSLQIEAGAQLLGRCIFSDGVEAKGRKSGAKETDARSETAESSQELVRLAARLRRTAG